MSFNYRKKRKLLISLSVTYITTFSSVMTGGKEQLSELKIIRTIYLFISLGYPLSTLSLF
ncbi:hypothetical protein J3Q64DRAFT_1737238 [Phycomyces blakesleeanus]|uniref:Uncharacterized protein n=1 Tax=Phycomyces blakesleeanus TaxID=4837 RepID=A0ABR3B3S8_PHYBL